jgi:hypothetical protein
VNVIVLAGEKRVSNENTEENTNKAFYKIKDKHMIQYVIETLRKCSSVDRIAVVGPRGKLQPVIGDMVDNILEGTDSIVSNILLALEQGVDLCYSIVDKKVNDLKYPEVRRTYARLWEGQFTGGNVFYFNPAVTDKCKDFVEKMLEYRKSPTKMARVLGFGFLLRLALGILTINAIQRKCESLLGIKGAAIISPYPEIGNDVDRLSDLEYIEKYM